jgi:hypothetical protein
MTAIQILIAAFVMFAVWRTVGRFREAELSWPWFILWLVMWIALGVGAVLPQTTEWFARMIGVGRGVDAVLYASVIFLFYLEFRLYLRQERLEHEISVLVRQIGLEDFRQREAARLEREEADE